jgi:molybdenum cofactor cytidylyltransferase
MKFHTVPSARCAGTILAHSLRAEGLVIAKGTTLTAADAAALQAQGIDAVLVAEPEAGDVSEDAAAAALAEALIQGRTGLRAGGAATGRVNLRATGPGIVELTAQAIRAVNHITPAITVASVPPWQRLDADALAATIKIIPYAVPRADLMAACAVAKGAMGLRRAERMNVTLIETITATGTPSDKGRRATAERVERLGASLTPPIRVPHQVEAIAKAVRAAPGQAILLLTGAATSDIRDTAPAALVHAGGEVAHFGMPVDPGNLLFLGTLHGKPVIGLPGCARSPALNGADWVLERVLCGVAVTSADIMDMGVGGLLKEIPSRPRVRRNTPKT